MHATNALILLSLAPLGCTATSSMRRGCQCLLGLTHQFFSTTSLCPLGFGEIKSKHKTVSFLQRYDRKDSNSVATSLSPEASLLLGEKQSTIITLIKIAGVHNIDFSAVRDDKCQTGVGNDKV